MKWRHRLLLGSTAGLMAVAGAQAADLPVKAKPVDYVRICTAYGSGFYYIPGTDICLRVGGFVYVETGWNGRSAVPLLYSNNIGTNLILDRDDNQLNMRARGVVILDARSQTPIGTVRSYIALGADYNNNTNGAPTPGNVTPYLERAFLQFAGFTAGYTASFFDFGAFYSIYTLSSIAYHWTPVFAYTARFDNGFSATISVEDGQGIRTRLEVVGGTTFTGGAPSTVNNYGGQQVPDIVANLRVDQAWGSAQISGALHQLRVNEATSITHGDKFGWAVLGGIEIKTPMIAPGDSIMLQGVYAKGAVEYTGISASQTGVVSGIGLKNTAGIGPIGWIYDAIPSTFTGSLELNTAWSANAMFRHFWQPNLRSAFWVGYNSYETAKPNPAFAYSPDLHIWQVGGNIIWSPVPTLDLSLDLLWSRVDTGACPNAAAAVQLANCNTSADIWSVWTRWRRNF